MAGEEVRRGARSRADDPALCQIYPRRSFGYAFTLFGGRLQFLAAVVSTGSTLVAVSVGLKCWLEQKSGRIGQSWLWLAVAGLFPLLTLIAQGFLGYGFVAVLIVASFVASQTSRWKTALAGVFLIYFGLSIYVTYMRDRTDIRDVVWGGQAFDARFDQLASTFRSVEWFDPGISIICTASIAG